ncbi:MAG: DUF4340 domain-containing protein [Planctomycetota bacterium]
MSRFNWTLLILLAIQVLVILVIESPLSSGIVGRSSSRSRVFYPDFMAEEAVRISLRRGDASLNLTRSSSGSRAWFVQAAGGEKRPADSFRVDSLLSSITLMKEGEVHSRNPGKAAVFGLDESSAVRVEVFDGKQGKLIDLLVGKYLGPVRGTYVKRIDGDEVFLVLENLRRYCIGDEGDWIDFWQDRTVFSFSPSSVKAVIVKNGTGEMIAEYAAEDGPAGTWRMLRPRQGKMKKEAEEAMLEAIAGLKSREDTLTAGSPEALGLDRPEWIVEIAVEEDGLRTVHTLSMGKERSGYRYVMTDGEPSALYKVPEYSLSPLLQDPLQVLEGED